MVGNGRTVDKVSGGEPVARVFISYATGDRELANEIRDSLDTFGHWVFLDNHRRDGILIGEDWQDRLLEELRRADALISVVTSDFLHSDWCMVEVATAHEQGKHLFPLAAGADPTAVPLLGRLQHFPWLTDRDEAIARVDAALRALDTGGALGIPDARSPYPGLEPFDRDTAWAFVGRGSEVRRLSDLVRSPGVGSDGALVVVVGPSGCGKSSLVRAGLLPALLADPGWWALPPLVPGADPVGALARAFTECGRDLGLPWTLDRVRARLAGGIAENPVYGTGQTSASGNVGSVVAMLGSEILAAAPRGHRDRLLVVVDQLEELLTRAALAQRAQLIQLLAPALKGSVRVVATLRSESVGSLQQSAELCRLPKDLFLLDSINSTMLPVVIEEPARRARIKISKDLLGTLVADTTEGDALPLLAFTLNQLGDGVKPGGELSMERYVRLGGVSGTLARQADLAVADRTRNGRSRDEVLASLLRLVTVDDEDRPVRRRIFSDSLTESEAADLTAFLDRRLLSSSTEDGRTVIAVAHERFITQWSPLKTAIEAQASVLWARRALEQTAGEWDRAGRPRSYLWERERVAAAKVHLDRGWWRHRPRTRLGPIVETLGQQATAFVDASLRRHHQRLRARATALTAVFLVLTGTTIVALVQRQDAVESRREAEHQRDTATARQLVAQAAAVRDSDPRLAIQLELAALRLSSTPALRSVLIETLAADRYLGTIYYQPRGRVNTVTYSPDGRTLALGGKAGAALVDAVDGGPAYRQLPAHRKGGVNATAFSASGKILATGGEEVAEAVRLWDVSDPHQPRPLGSAFGDGGGANTLAISPDGSILVVGGGGDQPTPTLWNISDPARPRRLPVLGGKKVQVRSIAFSPDGKLIAVGGTDGSITLWSMARGESGPELVRHRELVGLTGLVHSLSFSPDGASLAGGSLDGQTAVWDLSGGIHPQFLATGSQVNAVAFSPDGRTLASAGNDHRVTLWDLSDVDNPTVVGSPLAGHSDNVQSIAFSPDGARLASAGIDGSVILWDLAERATAPALVGAPRDVPHDPISSLSTSPDGSLLAAGSPSGVEIWNLTGRSRPQLRSISGERGGIAAVAFAPRLGILATGSTDNTVSLWRIDGNEVLRTLGSPITGPTSPVSSVSFSADGRLLAVGSGDKTVTVFDVSDPAAPRQAGMPLHEPQGPVSSVAWSRGGRVLAAGSTDGKVYLWDYSAANRPVATGVPLTGPRSPINSVTFSPDGRTVAAGSDDHGTWLWDIVGGEDRKAPGRRLSGPSSPVNSIAFSPDGLTVAAGSNDFSVTLWDRTDPGQPRLLGRPLSGPTRPVRAILFSENGRSVIAGSDDHVLTVESLDKLYDIRGKAVEHACARTGGGLSREQWNSFVPGIPFQNSCP